MANGHKPMYQPWVESEFWGDPMVRTMDATSRWIYRALCQAAFVCETRPYLPDDDNALWVLAGCDDKETFLSKKSKILPMFKKRGKVLVHKRIEQDYQKWEEISGKRRDSAYSRWGASAMQVDCESNASGMQEKRSKDKISNSSKYQFPETKLEAKAREIFGYCEDKKYFKKNLRALVKNHSESSVMEGFEFWAKTAGYSGKYPAKAFIQYMNSSGQLNDASISVSELESTIDEIVHLTGEKVLFLASQKPVLAKLISEFSAKEVVDAFMRFWDNIQDEFQLKFASKNFVETADQLMRNYRREEKERVISDEKTEALKAEFILDGKKELADIEGETESTDNFFEKAS